MNTTGNSHASRPEVDPPQLWPPLFGRLDKFPYHINANDTFGIWHPRDKDVGTGCASKVLVLTKIFQVNTPSPTIAE